MNKLYKNQKVGLWNRAPENLITSAHAEIYLGKSAGKQLFQEMKNAKEEIIVLSPYIDSDTIDELIKLNNRGISIHLGFCNLSENQRDVILKKLIRQNRITNHEIVIQKNKLIQKFKFIANASIITSILSFLIPILYLIFKASLHSLTPLFVIFCGLGLALTWIYSNKKKNSQKIRVNSYEYENRINFKYFRNNYNFIHSKVFIIDKRIAFLGSVNFTMRGFIDNLETRIKITDSKTISDLRNYIFNLLEEEKYYSGHETAWLGKRTFYEPPF